MGDPYRILGVSPNASEEEIKNAYRALARKYQSENYAGNPLGDIAAQKMKELDEAYDAVITMRRSGGAGEAPRNIQIPEIPTAAVIITMFALNFPQGALTMPR